MYRLCLFFITTLLCVYPIFGYGQTEEMLDLHAKATRLIGKSNTEALQMFEENLKQQDNTDNAEEFFARTYRNAGVCLLLLDNLHKSEKYLNEAIRRYLTIIKKDSKQKGRLAQSYRHLARTLRRKGEFAKAKESADKALSIFSELQNGKYEVEILYLIANIHIDNAKYKTAEQTCQEAIEKWNLYQLDLGILANIYHTLAIANEKQNKFKTAIKYNNEAIAITEDTTELAKTYANIGLLHTELKNKSEADKYLKKALQLKKRTYRDEYNFNYAMSYEGFGKSEMIKANTASALDYYQLALQNLTDNFRNQDININPSPAGKHYIYNKPDLIRVLDLKAQAALKSGNTNLAHDTYQVLDKWINEFYKDLNTNESKLTWIERAHATYTHAIEVALVKKDKERAFEYAEKAHAVLLWQSLSQQAAKSSLSEEDRKEMNNLNAKIRQADQQYRYGEIKIDVLRSLKSKRETLERTFDEKYPLYAQRKYQPEVTTVRDIQLDIIDDYTVFIEYYLADSTLYTFTITKNGLEITQQNANGLADDITDFVNNISGKSRMKTASTSNESDTSVTLRSDNNSLQKMDVQNYHKLAYKLYEQLTPSIIRLNDNINRLVIVPDREIGKLPFAALTTQVASGNLNKNTPFLVKKYTTNYLYSAGSYLKLQQRKADQRYCFAGIAPVEYQMKQWQQKSLPASEQELDEIKDLHWSWQSEVLMREAATKVEFERIIKEGYRTIQVSTHAVFDENKGQIIFHDSALTQDEIDQLEINTHRLILSACETGVGVQNQGEGILSLGWNFAYKGVPSITMTHWSVSDNSTKDIMIRYHQNLNDGIPADEALQEAQQYYLENIISDTQANPRYWAAFFHTGNVR